MSNASLSNIHSHRRHFASDVTNKAQTTVVDAWRARLYLAYRSAYVIRKQIFELQRRHLWRWTDSAALKLILFERVYVSPANSTSLPACLPPGWLLACNGWLQTRWVTRTDAVTSSSSSSSSCAGSSDSSSSSSAGETAQRPQQHSSLYTRLCSSSSSSMHKAATTHRAALAFPTAS